MEKIKNDIEPIFLCQHTHETFNCNFYKVIDKDYYSIKTGCRYLSKDGSCFNTDCIENYLLYNNKLLIDARR